MSDIKNQKLFSVLVFGDLKYFQTFNGEKIDITKTSYNTFANCYDDTIIIAETVLLFDPKIEEEFGEEYYKSFDFVIFTGEFIRYNIPLITKMENYSLKRHIMAYSFSGPFAYNYRIKKGKLDYHSFFNFDFSLDKFLSQCLRDISGHCLFKSIVHEETYSCIKPAKRT